MLRWLTFCSTMWNDWCFLVGNLGTVEYPKRKQDPGSACSLFIICLPRSAPGFAGHSISFRWGIEANGRALGCGGVIGDGVGVLIGMSVHYLVPMGLGDEDSVSIDAVSLFFKGSFRVVDLSVTIIIGFFALVEASVSRLSRRVRPR
ncbi:hypothetical protein EDD17DRAFT_1527640 [Pisolithus thermaeus]|nr:hypothetical protein EDD17DRAFT_1527640 [Pisolithus thermaeus]